jgi:hypothetical protein
MGKRSSPLETARARAQVTKLVPAPRSQFRCRSLAVAAGIILALPSVLASGKVVAEENPLSAPLVLRDTQSGFAGETSNVWKIAPHCSFTVARQIGLNVLEPYKKGQLTLSQRGELKAVLDRMAATAHCRSGSVVRCRSTPAALHSPMAGSDLCLGCHREGAISALWVRWRAMIRPG